MKKSKWTKGPWHLDRFTTADKDITIGEVAVRIDYDDVNHKEQEANAHLIAAAPELYEALAGLVEMAGAHPQPDGSINGPWDKAVNALKKARGEQ